VARRSVAIIDSIVYWQKPYDGLEEARATAIEPRIPDADIEKIAARAGGSRNRLAASAAFDPHGADVWTGPEDAE